MQILMCCAHKEKSRRGGLLCLKKKKKEPIQVNVGQRNKHGPKKERQMSYFYNLYVKNQRQYKRWRTKWELRNQLKD